MSPRHEVRYEIPDGVDSVPCRGCNERIYWVKTKNDRPMPVNPDGTPHWATCRKAAEFRKKGGG